MNTNSVEYPPLTSLAEAEQYAAQHGIRLTATDREQISRVQLAEKRRLAVLSEETERSGTFRLVEVFNRLYPRLLESLLGIGEILLTFTQTLIIAFGVPIALVLLLIVEQQRVVHGISLFEVEPALAHFAATALVILNLVLEFTIEHLETRARYRTSAFTQFSLRTWLSSVSYVLGIGPRLDTEKCLPCTALPATAATRDTRYPGTRTGGIDAFCHRTNQWRMA